MHAVREPGGDSDQAIGRYPAVWMEMVRGCPASDEEYRVVEEVVRICKLRRINLDITVEGMWKSQAEASGA
jgi:hypothetical protein